MVEVLAVDEELSFEKLVYSNVAPEPRRTPPAMYFKVEDEGLVFVAYKRAFFKQ